MRVFSNALSIAFFAFLHAVISQAGAFAQTDRYLQNKLPTEVVENGEVVSFRIVGGAGAQVGSWPSMVSIYYRPFDSGAVFCGGAVIDRQWVLTAAHCVYKRKAGDFFIREGASLPGKGRMINVREVKIHENYDPSRHLNDVALMYLENAAQVPRQILMSAKRSPEFIKDNNKSTVVGFGAISAGGPSSERLLYVDLPLVAETRCQQAYGADKITNATLCAGLDQGGKDSCQGDSGGPLYVRDEFGQAVQAGVVSWGEGCAKPGKYGVYASVPNFESWISSAVPNATFLPVKNQPAQKPTDSVVASFVSAPASSQPGQLAQVSVDILPGERIGVGKKMAVRVTSSVAGNLVVFNQEADGKSYQIFPNKFVKRELMPGQAKTRIAAGETITIPGSMDAFQLTMTPPLGRNRLIALVIPPEVKTDDVTSANEGFQPIANLDDVLKTIVDREYTTRGVSVEAAEPKNRAVGVRDYQIVE